MELAQYLDFSKCWLFPLDIHELEPVIDLYSDFLSRRFVNCLSHNGISSTTYLLPKLIVTQVRAAMSRELSQSHCHSGILILHATASYVIGSPKSLPILLGLSKCFFILLKFPCERVLLLLNCVGMLSLDCSSCISHVFRLHLLSGHLLEPVVEGCLYPVGTNCSVHPHMSRIGCCKRACLRANRRSCLSYYVQRRLVH